ncbi:MAG TPA: TraB/GumN family protein [Thermomonas sp.]|jgi:uncharacterized protein YbaP (TraB family)|uniref:TraB/GumN family protein n=1 Tax=Thermomonas sp. TaxID=1971895 RepID=UPI002C748E9F|nr:TraB/GumN family protein [Thermomonas sp.]HOV96573.1 TraB/GumN family protein [Thermomonas sp.]
MRLAILAATLISALVSPSLRAQQAPAIAATPKQATGDIRTEATVVVEGEQPGPGLWLVRSPDGQHELYILGLLSPLPDKMQWQSAQVSRVLANAQEVIRTPSVDFKVDVGWFKGLMLLPKMLGARNNPDDKRLQEVVSPASYARWQALKARYIGSDGSVEKWRPLFAAQELYGKAMKKSGLDGSKIISPIVDQAIAAHHPTVTVVKESIVVTDPKPLLKEWSKTSLDDLACFDNTMTQLETDIDAMRARANAWATGDIAGLRALPPAYQWEACSNAITEAGIGKRLGFGDANKKVEAKWMAAAEAALGKNTVTFAMLPLGKMLAANGYLAKLQAKGYTVIAPDAE